MKVIQSKSSTFEWKTPSL